MRPNKSDVLSYLDAKGDAPARYAQVKLRMAAREDAIFSDILVGPLPVNNATTKWQPLNTLSTRKTGGTVRDLNVDREKISQHLTMPLAKSIEDITKGLWNATVTLPFGNATGNGTSFPPFNRSDHAAPSLFIMEIDPVWQDDGRVIRWFTFWKTSVEIFDTSTLLPTGLHFMADTTGRDPSKWKLGGWFYNNVFYNSTESFRQAYHSPGFEKLGSGTDGPWAWTQQQGDKHPMDKTLPPAAAASSSPRYSVDPDRKYVEWMGFSFYIAFTRDTGVSLFDIRYKGERVLYELGLQEALAHYAGIKPP